MFVNNRLFKQNEPRDSVNETQNMPTMFQVTVNQNEIITNSNISNNNNAWFSCNNMFYLCASYTVSMLDFSDLFSVWNRVWTNSNSTVFPHQVIISNIENCLEFKRLIFFSMKDSYRVGTIMSALAFSTAWSLFSQVDGYISALRILVWRANLLGKRNVFDIMTFSPV